MSWYRTGTIAVTNGSTNVVGTGTAWVGQILIGSAIHLPDGRAYEVANIVSDTQLTLGSAYLGATVSGQAYAVQPTQGWAQRVNQQVAAWIALQQGYLDGPLAGRFGDGTAALPGLAFLTDLDTGLRRPGANRMAFVTNALDRLEVNNAGAILTGLLSGTAVVQSNTDTTAGRLPTTGWMGAGGPTVSLAGAENLKDRNLFGGFYNYSANVTAGGPESSAWLHAIFAAKLGQGRQALLDMRTAGGGAARLWFGSNSNAGDDIVWSEIFHARNILGTVSQSGGIPTGAVIERGSNANGEYVRFADGTQICTFTGPGLAANSAYGAVFRNSSTPTWTYPAGFTNPPVIGGAADRSDRWVCPGAPGIGGVAYRVQSAVSDSTEYPVRLTAIGRWF
ncbi:hypothetical protein [Szabonella alba]|uniref:Uncharacterized protein n=1 Tax=Szabonella alba TaxID=2804194 RepID=A0A8K0V9V4_9RHOB|nr:hypothetical protein [Szabonella alba]MBL4917993.1 hypothetical protein [Szabonella alba]